MVVLENVFLVWNLHGGVLVRRGLCSGGQHGLCVKMTSSSASDACVLLCTYLRLAMSGLVMIHIHDDECVLHVKMGGMGGVGLLGCWLCGVNGLQTWQVWIAVWERNPDGSQQTFRGPSDGPLRTMHIPTKCTQ